MAIDSPGVMGRLVFCGVGINRYAILWKRIPTPAGMAELADAADSKSAGPCGHGGSTPPPGTKLKLHKIGRTQERKNVWTTNCVQTAAEFPRPTSEADLTRQFNVHTGFAPTKTDRAELARCSAGRGVRDRNAECHGAGTLQGEDAGRAWTARCTWSVPTRRRS